MGLQNGSDKYDLNDEQGSPRNMGFGVALLKKPEAPFH